MLKLLVTIPGHCDQCRWNGSWTTEVKGTFLPNVSVTFNLPLSEFLRGGLQTAHDAVGNCRGEVCATQNGL